MTHPVSPHQSTLRMARRYGLILLLLAVFAAAWGIFSRERAHAALARETARYATLHVGVVSPQTENGLPDLVLPGGLQAWTEIPVYAHASGYLERWFVDIGAPVRAGQLIAILATPEVDQEVRQARADVATAQADADLAQVTADRWRKLLATHTVSQQDADTKIDQARAAVSTLHSAQAHLASLTALDLYQRIVSPVDGIITARNTDIGTMIDTGSANGNARELFHVADVRRMRVYVPVPETEARQIHLGRLVALTSRSWPGRTWQAKITDTARAIDPTSHTLLVQLQLDNPDRSLLPGGYVEVRFPRSNYAATLLIPANSLIFNAGGTQVATVDPHGTVHLQPVRIGRDFGQTLEVRSGLKPDDTIIVSPPDALVDGVRVIPRPVAFPQKERS